MLALLADLRLLRSHAGLSPDPPPPPSTNALGYLSCVSSFGSGMATGPAIGRSLARLCADASELPGSPGPQARGFLRERHPGPAPAPATAAATTAAPREED